MKKKKHSKEMVEVLAIVDFLKPKFFLQGWTITIGVHEENDFDVPTTAARIKPSNCYRSAALEIFPIFFKEDPETKRAMIIHELCHIIAGIQQGLLNTARNGIQVTTAENSYAYEEETSWFAQIIDGLI